MRRESDNALISPSNFFEPCFFGLRRVDLAIKSPTSPSTFARHSRYPPLFPRVKPFFLLKNNLGLFESDVKDPFS